MLIKIVFIQIYPSFFNNPFFNLPTEPAFQQNGTRFIPIEKRVFVFC